MVTSSISTSSLGAVRSIVGNRDLSTRSSTGSLRSDVATAGRSGISKTGNTNSCSGSGDTKTIGQKMTASAPNTIKPTTLCLTIEST